MMLHASAWSSTASEMLYWMRLVPICNRNAGRQHCSSATEQHLSLTLRRLCRGMHRYS